MDRLRIYGPEGSSINEGFNSQRNLSKLPSIKNSFLKTNKNVTSSPAHAY